MKLNRSNLSVKQEFRTALPFTYSGAVLLKMLSMPIVKHLSLKTITFSAVIVALGTAIGKKGITHLSPIDFHHFSQAKGEHFLKTVALIASAIGVLFLTQKHPFIRSLPKFMHLTLQESLLLGLIQGTSVSLSLLFYRIDPSQKTKKSPLKKRSRFKKKRPQKTPQ